MQSFFVVIAFFYSALEGKPSAPDPEARQGGASSVFRDAPPGRASSTPRCGGLAARQRRASAGFQHQRQPGCQGWRGRHGGGALLPWICSEDALLGTEEGRLQGLKGSLQAATRCSGGRLLPGGFRTAEQQRLASTAESAGSLTQDTQGRAIDGAHPAAVQDHDVGIALGSAELCLLYTSDAADE